MKGHRGWIGFLAAALLVSATAAEARSGNEADRWDRVHQAFRATKGKLASDEGRDKTIEKGRFRGDRPVTRFEVAVILDRYLDLLRKQREELESKIDTIPLQRRLPDDVLQKLDDIVNDLTAVGEEEMKTRNLITEITRTLQEHGLELTRLRISDLALERRVEKLEELMSTAGAVIPERGLVPLPLARFEDDEDPSGVLAERLQRVEDLVFKNISQVNMNTAQIQGMAPVVDRVLAAARYGDESFPGRVRDMLAAEAIVPAEPTGFESSGRPPFMAAGGSGASAQRVAYRRKLIQRLRQKIEASRIGGGTLSAEPQASALLARATPHASGQSPPSAAQGREGDPFMLAVEDLKRAH